MLKKLMLTSLIASALSLGLTACGGGDGGGDTDSNKTLTISSIEVGNDSIYRSDNVYTDGNITERETSIVGALSDFPEEEEEWLILASNFAGTSSEDLFEKNLRVYDNKWSSTIYGNDGKKITWGYQYKDKDISGVTAKSKTYTQLQRSSLGFNENAKFPVGSACKVLTEINSTMPYYDVEINDGTKKDTLEKWMQSHSDKNIQTEQVGENNEYTIAYYDVFFDDGEYKSRNARIDYKGKAYYADYYQAQKANSEEKVGCHSYNDIAMDYMIEQIKKKANAQ